VVELARAAVREQPDEVGPVEAIRRMLLVLPEELAADLAAAHRRRLNQAFDVLERGTA
jgi:hypothetical protein